MQKSIQGTLPPIVLVILLSVGGTARAKELFFPIVTHVGNYKSAMVILNPSEFRVSYYMKGLSPDEGGVGLSSTLQPNGRKGFSPDGEFNPKEFRGGWGFVKYSFLEVLPVDKERVESLRLLGWTQLALLGPSGEWIAVANIPAVEPALEFRVPGILYPEAEAAIAILNPSKEPIQIDLTLYHYRKPLSGSPYVQVTNTISIPPMQRLSQFLWELMTESKETPPERPLPWTSTSSTLRIRGSAPIAVGALLYYHSTGAFGNLPVVRVAQ